MTERTFAIGNRVTKRKGSRWTGRVVGFYSTALTPEGYAVESENEHGSVQIYPAAALALAAPCAELADLEWTEDGYSLQTPFDGDVDGDGRHIVVGGDLVATFDDSEIADKYRHRVIAALSCPGAGVDWQPLSTLKPADGDEFLVVNDRGMFVAMWDADWSTEPDERYPHLGRGWFMVGDGKDIARPLRSDYPRLWAPLPTVPAIEPESEK